jgi:3-carboxy-cis,cis-muconate cycloisomerase
LEYDMTPFGMETGLLSPGWADTGANEMLGDRAWVQAMLDVEVALAGAQAELGVIPQAAADVIARAAHAECIDLHALAAGVRATANPVVELVIQFTAAVSALDDDATNYVHRGSTSQDILDSAMMLLCHRAFTQIVDNLDRCAAALARLVREHRLTVMAGRTLTQHAVPTTFGWKAATWLQLVLDAAQRLRRVLDTGLPASLGGAAGTLSAYHEFAVLAGVSDGDGIDLIAPFASRLGLSEPLVPWHGIRTPLADVASGLCVLAGALGKVAVDVQVLTRTEIGEVAEPAAPGRGASSAMPQKHNPVLATMIAVVARQLPLEAIVLFQSMVAEDERSAGAWHAEWQPLRECLRLAIGASTNAAELAEGLVVFPERMRANLALTGGAVVSERINAVLAPDLGKAAAKRLLTQATDEAARSGADLAEVITRLLAGHGHQMSLAGTRELLDPARYTGAAALLADRVLAHYRNGSWCGAVPAAPQPMSEPVI